MARQIPRAAGGILSYFVRHRTVANLLLLVMLVAGLSAIPNMRAQFFPDVILDNVMVTTVWDGAGAEDVDAAIIQVLEPGLLSVEGVESTTSVSREGRGVITLEFAPGWDMARAADDVQAAIDQVTVLPDDAEDPSVKRGAWRDRVTDVVITGPVAPEQLGLFADELVTRLFAVGVTRTTIRGIAAPQIMVEVPTGKLIAFDIGMADIAAAIAEEVNADPAGDVTGANARVRTGVQKRTAEEIASIVLRSNPDGSTLSIGDVATVTREGVDRNRTYFVGEEKAVSVRIDRSNTGDAIAMQAQVQEAADAMQLTLPRGVTIELIRTRAEAISSRLDLLVDNALTGLGLVVALLFLFLNARTAFWVAAGIPVALLAAIAFMWIGGLTINMISLFGLIITLGIVVDDAIVVGEHADHRARVLGESPVEAAEGAANRMAMPVFAATLTTVIAFFGLIAVGGRFGDLIRDIPFTVIAVLIASLIECFLILPNHMSHALAKSGQAEKFSRLKLLVGLVVSAIVIVAVSSALFIAGHALFGFFFGGEGVGESMLALLRGNLAQQYYFVIGLLVLVVFVRRSTRIRAVAALGIYGVDAPSMVINIGFDWVRARLFRPFMGLVIRARYVVLAGAIVVLATQVSLFISGEVKWRFFNAPERGSVTGNFAMVEGATRSDTLEMMREMQRATEELGADTRPNTVPIRWIT
jgi:multidrug efflux pump subunit AcrB